MTNKKKLISIRLDPELIERLDNLAPDWNDTRSGLIEFILEKHLPEMEEFTTFIQARASQDPEAHDD